MKTTTDALAEVLPRIRKGEFGEELSDEIRKAAVRAASLQKPAVVTIKLVLKPMQDQMWINGTVDSKLPKPDVKDSCFFVLGDGNLSTKDPQQMELDGVTG